MSIDWATSFGRITVMSPDGEPTSSPPGQIPPPRSFIISPGTHSLTTTTTAGP